MRKFETVDGVAALLDRDNIDTDQMLPAAFMRGADPDYKAGLFALWRRDPDFILSRPGWSESRILVSGDNFGCGSTREHAAWALDAFGIRVLIANSYGEVFRDNCIKNGILPIEGSEPVRALLRSTPEPVRLQVDLVAGEVRGPGAFTMPFSIPPSDRTMLLEGLDEIGLTLLGAEGIDAWEARERGARPWRQTLILPS